VETWNGMQYPLIPEDHYFRWQVNRHLSLPLERCGC